LCSAFSVYLIENKLKKRVIGVVKKQKKTKNMNNITSKK